MSHEIEAVKRLVGIGSLLNTDKKRIQCPLPAHTDKHPSCDVDHDRGLWHCKACDVGGDIFSLLMHRDRKTFHEALVELAGIAGVSLDKKKSAEAETAWEREKRIRQAARYAADYYHKRIFDAKGIIALLEARCITLDCVEKMRLGVADGSLVEHLQASPPEGLSFFDFSEAGLIIQDKHKEGAYRDYFRDRITFPLVIHGEVLNISGRAIMSDINPKYLHLAGRATDYFYNEDAIGDKIWLFEGHPDTVVGLRAGLPAVGVIGTSGMTHPERLRHCREIYICGDADAAGQKAIDKWAAEILKHNPSVSIKFVSLTGGAKDFNEWYIKNQGEIGAKSLELEANAKDFMAFKISKLKSTDDLITVWPLVESQPQIVRDAYFRQIKIQLPSLSVVAIRKEFNDWCVAQKASQPGAQIIEESYDGEDLIPVNAFAQTDGVILSHVCLYAKVKRQQGEETTESWEPRIIQATIDPRTGGYKAQSFSPDEREGYNPLTVPLRSVVSKRWGNASIQKFLKGEAEPVNTADLLRDLSAYFQRYIWHENPITYDVLAVYAMGTYIARAFRAFPYMALNGLAGSGKTNLLTLLYEVCFNAFMVTNNSVATLFRVIGMCFPTYIRDEAEQFNKTTPENQEEKEILNSGYKRGGVVPRMDKGKNGEMRVIDFNVYSPKIFAGINMLDNTLLTRSILISMFKAPKAEVGKLVSMSHNASRYLRESAALRDRLYQWGLTKFHLVHHLFENFPPQDKITNRDWEIWSPLLAIALLADNEDASPGEEPFVQRVLRLSEEKTAERRELEQDNAIEKKAVATLLGILENAEITANHGDWYEMPTVAKTVSERLVGEGYLKEEMKSRWLMKILTQTKVLTNRQEQIKVVRDVNHKNQKAVLLTADRVKEALERL